MATQTSISVLGVFTSDAYKFDEEFSNRFDAPFEDGSCSGESCLPGQWSRHHQIGYKTARAGTIELHQRRQRPTADRCWRMGRLEALLRS